MIIKGFIPTPFWDSMARERDPTAADVREDFFMKLAEQQYDRFCASLVNSDSPDYYDPPQKYTIPPLIHLIWLGSPVTPRGLSMINYWKKCHPGWEVKVWTDEEVKDFSWTSQRIKTSYENAKTWAEKADLLRLEILYEYGGIYSDMDVVCLKSFRDLVTSEYSFIGGLEMNYKKGEQDLFFVGTAIMAAAKGSRLIKFALEQYQTETEAPEKILSLRAGPGLISKGCQEAMRKNNEKILILPCSYFFPLPYKNKTISVDDILNFVNSEALAIHLWEASWLK